MNLPKVDRPQQSLRARYQVWKADMALRHGWFRVLLHVQGMACRPRNIRWHWRLLTHEFYDRKPRE